MWWRIAERLGMSPSEAKAKHSATDLLRWAQRFEDELNEFHREDHGIARVAYEVYELRATLAAIFGSKLPPQKVEEFIPKFEMKQQEVALAEMPDDEREEKLKEFSKASQARWLGAFGLDGDGKPIRTNEDVAAYADPPLQAPLQAREGRANSGQSIRLGEPAPTQKIRRTIKPGGGE